MKEADIIVPRGGENDVAINLIVKQVMTQLIKRGDFSNVSMRNVNELRVYRTIILSKIFEKFKSPLKLTKCEFVNEYFQATTNRPAPSIARS